jgi:hypothetical protein
MRCSIRTILFWICLLAECSALQAVDIYIAPLLSVSEDHLLTLSRDEQRFGELFYDAVLSTDKDHVLDIRLLHENDLIRNQSIKSVMDAGELCEKYNIDYLVYGFYKKTYQYIEAEIRIYERETKENKKVFYAKAEPGELSAIKDELAQKLVRYFYTLLGVDEASLQKPPAKSFGGIEIYGGTGYWTPMGEWFDLITGIVTVEAGVYIQPDDIIFYNPDWLVLFRYGFVVSYMLGLNKPDIEESYLHSLQLEFPARLCLLFLARHVAYAGVGVFYRHDFVYQVRLYGSPVWSNSGTLGVSGAGGYEYWCGEDKLYAFGAELKLDAAFYDHPVIRLALLFTFKYRLDFGPNAAAGGVKAADAGAGSSAAGNGGAGNGAGDQAAE